LSICAPFEPASQNLLPGRNATAILEMIDPGRKSGATSETKS
jgi:hypothetical protein